MEYRFIFNSIKKYIFSSPFFPNDEYQTRINKVLNQIILNYWLIFFIAFSILIISVHKVGVLIVLSLMLMVLLTTEYFRWKNIFLASNILFSGIWIIITIVYLLTGLPLNDFSLWYVPFIIGVALLLGRTWSYFYATISFVLIVIHLSLYQLGFVIEPYFVVKWYTGVIIFFIGFIQTISPINLMISSLHESEDKYKNLSAKLEEKDIERTNQLEEANKELELYAYSLSHDIRNPLEAIESFVNYIELNHKSDLPESVAEIINKIGTNSKKTNNLAKNLLQYFQIREQILNEKETDINKILEDILGIYTDEIEKRKIKIEIGKLPNLICDPFLIRQVWINLISNAIKYTKFSPVPTIEIGSYNEQGKNIYFIKDNGIGFDMEKGNLLFQPFFRLYNSKEIEGTGIGLAFVKSIIDKHGGKIWFVSKENKGTSFFFSLK